MRACGRAGVRACVGLSHSAPPLLNPLRAQAWRLCVFGPAYVLWMRGLERWLGSSKAPSTVAKKILLDQLVFTPPNLYALFSGMALMEGKGIDDAISRSNHCLW